MVTILKEKQKQSVMIYKEKQKQSVMIYSGNRTVMMMKEVG